MGFHDSGDIREKMECERSEILAIRKMMRTRKKAIPTPMKIKNPNYKSKFYEQWEQMGVTHEIIRICLGVAHAPDIEPGYKLIQMATEIRDAGYSKTLIGELTMINILKTEMPKIWALMQTNFNRKVIADYQLMYEERDEYVVRDAFRLNQDNIKMALFPTMDNKRQVNMQINASKSLNGSKQYVRVEDNVTKLRPPNANCPYCKGVGMLRDVTDNKPKDCICVRGD